MTSFHLNENAPSSIKLRKEQHDMSTIIVSSKILPLSKHFGLPCLIWTEKTESGCHDNVKSMTLF